MTIYTVVAYRPDHDDYCRGCYMGGSPSEHEIRSAEDQDTAAKFIAQKDWENQNRDAEHAEWETTLLIDGLTPDDILVPDDEINLRTSQSNEVRKRSRVHLDQIAAEHEKKLQEERERKRLKKQAEQAAKAEQKAAQERAEYARLKAKFENQK